MRIFYNSLSKKLQNHQKMKLFICYILSKKSKTSKNEEFSYANPYQKSQKIMKKSWNFWFENQVKLSKFSGGLRPPTPPQVSLKMSVEPLWPRGGLVVLENTVMPFKKFSRTIKLFNAKFNSKLLKHSQKISIIVQKEVRSINFEESQVSHTFV